MMIRNEMKLEFTAISENVGIARIVAASFAAQLEFTLNTLEEIKVAVSEAVSNAIIHGYRNSGAGTVYMTLRLQEAAVEIIIADKGCGIADVVQARQPAYSSDPERMGLGFVFMESFMDQLEVFSEADQGTTVRMIKSINSEQTSQ